MKPGGGREKGNSFERRVAGMIVKAFECFGAGKSDAYRTPSSGGHQYAKKEDPGDLVISKKLRKWFPHHVECKNYRRVNFGRFLASSTERKKSWQEFRWLDQALSASKKYIPILVIKENHGESMCVVPVLASGFKPVPRLVFRYKNQTWCLCRFKRYLEFLCEKQKDQ